MELNYGLSFFSLNHLAALFSLVILPMCGLIFILYRLKQRLSASKGQSKWFLAYYMPVLFVWVFVGFFLVVPYLGVFMTPSGCKKFNADILTHHGLCEPSVISSTFFPKPCVLASKPWCDGEKEKMLAFGKKWEEGKKKWEEEGMEKWMAKKKKWEEEIKKKAEDKQKNIDGDN